MECKHFYAFRGVFSYWSLGSSCIWRNWRTKCSKPKVTRPWKQRDRKGKGKNVRFIERGKTRCLWNVALPERISGPLLRKWNSRLLWDERACWEKRRVVEKGRASEREGKGDGNRFSVVSYRNAEGNGRSETKVFLFLKERSIFPFLSFSLSLILSFLSYWITSHRFCSML